MFYFCKNTSFYGLQSLSHLVGYFILNVLLVLYPSLETVSEVFSTSLPPMMTRLLSWLTLQTLEATLFTVRLRGRVTQPPCWTLHCMQLLCVDEAYPPHTMFPACTWLALTSGSGGSSHVEFCHGRNNSADCGAIGDPLPPVIRMASEMQRLVPSRIYQHNHIIIIGSFE